MIRKWGEVARLMMLLDSVDIGNREEEDNVKVWMCSVHKG